MNLAPKWMLKEKFESLENNFSWIIPLTKLSGLVLSSGLAFLLISGVTILRKDRFIENKNAIYGLKFNSQMKEFGFQDTMKIIAINGKEPERVSDILSHIFLEDGNIEVSVVKNGIKSKILLNDDDKHSLMGSLETPVIAPIMYDSKGENKIIITTKNYGISEVLYRFGYFWNKAWSLIQLNPVLRGPFGIKKVSIFSSPKFYFSGLLLTLTFTGVLNLLLLPGFSVGNFIISVIETLRKKLYGKKSKRLIEWILISFTTVWLLIIVE
ncbi:hypothetical protein [Arcicella rigui]|uniref:Uncharacterized protein n=1 Tax=Arcicella rigui TaxID=797020 RepID=A0ABU5QGA0_9BACT|nr:hypothetical protein [Arcicella rigui]MEA5141890.1 hypothetical protein [Arcicella rigui]